MNHLPCFIGRIHSPQLVEGIHVERKVVQFPFEASQWRIDESVEFNQAVDIFPNLLVMGVEDMCSIFMDMNTIYFFAEDIASCMGALVNDQTTFSMPLSFVGKNGSEKSRSDYEIIIGFHYHSDLSSNELNTSPNKFSAKKKVALQNNFGSLMMATLLSRPPLAMTSSAGKLIKLRWLFGLY